jgi:NitT/TauT family transport system substrate-binding protein
VSEPKDLEGKTLGAPAPDGAYAQWNAFVEANGIDASTVTIENVGFPVREPMLAQGRWTRSPASRSRPSST